MSKTDKLETAVDFFLLGYFSSAKSQMQTITDMVVTGVDDTDKVMKLLGILNDRIEHLRGEFDCVELAALLGIDDQKK